MEILNQFGFDIKLFAAQIVNFLVIAYIFKRFLYKPLLATLKKRQELIAKGLKDAQKASEALENAENQKTEILGKASKESERILNETRQQSIVVRDEIMDTAKKDVEKLMEQTREQIKQEHDNFMSEAKKTSLEISRIILTETVKELFDKKEQEILIKKGITKLKNS